MGALLRRGPNRYLLDEEGRDLSGRGRATLAAFGFFGLSAVLAVGAVLFSSFVWPAVGLGVLSFAVFVAWPIVMWIRIMRGARLLEDATLAWHRSASFPGTPGAEFAVPAAHYALREVFRADFRVRAFHLLGLIAEQRGDFDEAQDLFARGETALPALAAPTRKRDARVLVAAHRALCLIALGQVGAARELLQRGSVDLGDTAPRAFDALMDDSSWGLGAISMNEVVMKMEAKRPPRAILGLAWALLHLAEGNPSLVLQLVQGERPILDPGLLPRERALLQRVHDLSIAALGPGPHRSPGVATAEGDPWINAVLAQVARA